jgi:hypothetical protein
MNVMDTIFDVRGLCDDGFRRQEREGSRAWRRSSALRRSVGLLSFFSSFFPWSAYIGSGAARFACIHICFHSNAGGQISQHAGNTHALLFFISFCMHAGSLCIRYLHVQQISFHGGFSSALLSFLLRAAD